WIGSTAKVDFTPWPRRRCIMTNRPALIEVVAIGWNGSTSSSSSMTTPRGSINPWSAPGGKAGASSAVVPTARDGSGSRRSPWRPSTRPRRLKNSSFLRTGRSWLGLLDSPRLEHHERVGGVVLARPAFARRRYPMFHKVTAPSLSLLVLGIATVALGR